MRRNIVVRSRNHCCKGNTTILLRCAIAVVCRKTNVEVNISCENTTVVVWIYGGI